MKFVFPTLGVGRFTKLGFPAPHLTASLMGTSPLPLPPAPPQVRFWAVLHESRSDSAQLLTSPYLGRSRPSGSAAHPSAQRTRPGAAARRGSLFSSARNFAASRSFDPRLAIDSMTFSTRFSAVRTSASRAARSSSRLAARARARWVSSAASWTHRSYSGEVKCAYRPCRPERDGCGRVRAGPDQAGAAATLATWPWNKCGYGLEFDERGEMDDLRIQFESIAAVLLEAEVQASQRGLRIALLRDCELLARLDVIGILSFGPG